MIVFCFSATGCNPLHKLKKDGLSESCYTAFKDFKKAVKQDKDGFYQTQYQNPNDLKQVENFDSQLSKSYSDNFECWTNTLSSAEVKKVFGEPMKETDLRGTINYTYYIKNETCQTIDQAKHPYSTCGRLEFVFNKNGTPAYSGVFMPRINHE